MSRSRKMDVCVSKKRRSAAQRRSAARRQRERQRQGQHQTAACASDCELIGMAWTNVLNRQHSIGTKCALPPVTGTNTCSTMQSIQPAHARTRGSSVVEAVNVTPARIDDDTDIARISGVTRNVTFDLLQGRILSGGSAVYAADGSAFLILQNTGRLVLYRGSNQLQNKGQIWASDEHVARQSAAHTATAAAGGYDGSGHSLDITPCECFALLRHTGEFAVFRGPCPPATLALQHQEQGLRTCENKGESRGMTKALRRCDKIWSSKMVSSSKQRRTIGARRTCANVATEYFLTVVGSTAAGAEGKERFEIHGCSDEKGEDMGIVASFPPIRS